MKQKFLFMALVAMLVGTFCSCNNGVNGNYPILYVVNGSDYSVNVYCDNQLVAAVNEHNNSGKVALANTSVNLPVYVEAQFYDNRGTNVQSCNWNNFYFKLNKSYKMTLTNTGGTLTAL